MKYLVFLLILLIPSCGPSYRYKQYKKHNIVPVSKYFASKTPLMDEEITPIFEEWLNESREYKTKPNWKNVNFILFSDTLSEKYAGLQVDLEGIYINDDFKNSPSLKVIVYHELGHGMFNLEHDTSKVNIMAPYFSDFMVKIYLTNWEKYKNKYWLDIKRNNQLQSSPNSDKIVSKSLIV